MRELVPITGKCFMRNEVTFGYFAQHHMDTIDMEATPLQFLRHVSFFSFFFFSIHKNNNKIGKFFSTSKLIFTNLSKVHAFSWLWYFCQEPFWKYNEGFKNPQMAPKVCEDPI
jgi:hypothetical protein